MVTWSTLQNLKLRVLDHMSKCNPLSQGAERTYWWNHYMKLGHLQDKLQAKFHADELAPL